MFKDAILKNKYAIYTVHFEKITFKYLDLL